MFPNLTRRLLPLGLIALATTACVTARQDTGDVVHYASRALEASTVIAQNGAARLHGEVRAQLNEGSGDLAHANAQVTGLGEVTGAAGVGGDFAFVPGSVALRGGVYPGVLSVEGIVGVGAAYYEWDGSVAGHGASSSALEVGPMAGAQISLTPCEGLSLRARGTFTFASDGSVVEGYQVSVGGHAGKNVEWSSGWRQTTWSELAGPTGGSGEFFCAWRLTF